MKAFQISHCRSSLLVRTWPLLTHLFSPRCPQGSLSSLPKFSSTFPLGGLAPLSGPRHQKPPSSLTEGISPTTPGMAPLHLEWACYGGGPRSIVFSGRPGTHLRSRHSEHTSQRDLWEGRLGCRAANIPSCLTFQSSGCLG